MAIQREDHIDKIHDESVGNAVGEVPQDAGYKKDRPDALERALKSTPAGQHGHHNKRHARKDYEKGIVVPEHSECRAGIVDLDKVEEARDDRHFLAGKDMLQDQPFRQLIGGEERKGQKDKKSGGGVQWLSGFTGEGCAMISGR